MKLFELLKHVDCRLIKGRDVEIENIAYDSRKISKNGLFVCIKGFVTDGHLFAKNAVIHGAAALICQEDLKQDFENVTVVLVPNTRKALSQIASEFYGNPSAKMNLVGVTGTNGKTTTTYLLREILANYGHRTGVIGTISNQIGERVIQTERTTPESLDLQKLFLEMANENIDDCVMEVSSHSLALDRTYNCHFSVGIFTNLTRDHLDLHQTFENYRDAKLKLFSQCENAVINIDDEYGDYMKTHGGCKRVITVGVDKEADLRAKNIRMDATGIQFTVNIKGEDILFTYSTPGKFSVYNCLGAIGAAIALNIPINTIQKGLAHIKGVAGRFQTVTGKKGVSAIVDYSHTPDGLLNVLKTIMEFKKGKVITVFGCGGDRDRTKRPIMGEVAGEYSDYAIITSDNPRSENPLAILKDIEAGMKKTFCPYEVICDRREAIQKAVQLATSFDIILVAGKGHENYQIFAERTVHFDDMEEVLAAFSEG